MTRAGVHVDQYSCTFPAQLLHAANLLPAVLLKVKKYLLYGREDVQTLEEAVNEKSIKFWQAAQLTSQLLLASAST